MLQLNIEAQEYYNDDTGMFINIPACTLQLEHSLVSISKWEMKWGKAFLGKQEKTPEELFDYVRCMTLNEDVNPIVYSGISKTNMKKITDYIEARMSATYVGSRGDEGGSGDTVTSELIYYWMTALQIPFECQYWHLNRLLTLIQICNIKNNPNKNKMSRSDILRRNSALNAQRRAKYHTRG